MNCLCKFAALAMVFVSFCVPAVAQKDKKPDFPDESQIKLLLTQSERAFEVYENALGMEKLQLTGEAMEGIRRDKEVLDTARPLLAKLRANPQLFNGPYGFLLVTTLDDASRNMAVCMGQGGMLAAGEIANGDTSAAKSKLLLSQTCQGASNLLYTVSESAVAMYQNYLLANFQLQDKLVEISNQCAEILKKAAPKRQ